MSTPAEVEQTLRRQVSGLLLIFMTLICLAGCGDDATYQPLPAGTRVLAFGDSVTHGLGASAGEDYPTRLAIATGWRVINAGLSGDTAREAKERIHASLEQHSPELVIIELGGNDFLRKRPSSTVKQDLREIIQASETSGAVTVLVAVPRLSLLRAGIGALADSPIYEELADETGVLLIPDVFSEVLSNKALLSDQIHPSAQGYQVLTDGFVASLREAGLLR
jgi:acyl-CoA thioesterase-1